MTVAILWAKLNRSNIRIYF